MRTRQSSGFTIVELLIVIVIIAILAAISVVVYSGVQTRAVKTALQSDLRNAATKIDLAKAESGSYPTDSGQALALFTPSAGTDYQYTSDGSTYYLTIRSNKVGIPAYCKSSTNSIVEGPCPGHSGPVVGGGEGENEGVVTTLAGSDDYGYVDGPGASAQFFNVTDIAVNSAGVVYVADTTNHRIRKVMPDGTVSTFAGSGNPGHLDGTGTAAELQNPGGITVDSSGNVYVTETGAHDIRKITPSGVVTTLAGSSIIGDTGYVDGTGGAARFSWPKGIAVDAGGHLYVADTGNACVRKVSPAGVVTTFAGSCGNPGNADGTGTAARFSDNIQHIAIDGSGNLYLTDVWNDVDNGASGLIRKITPGGVVTSVSNTVFIDYWGGLAPSQAVAVDAGGNLYFTDTRWVDEETVNVRLMRRSTSGEVTAIAGSSRGYADGTGANAQFNYITALTISNSGTIYAADDENHRVRKIEQ